MSFDEQLSAVLARHIDGFESLLSADQLTAGASQETYRVAVKTSAGEKVLALRRSVPTLEGSSSVGTIDLETEARLMQLAGAAGIPEPEVYAVLEDVDGLGEGFLMEWLEGETLGQRITRSESLAAIRPQLAYQCGEALARVHALDLGSSELQLPEVSPAELIDETWAHYRDLDVPVPMIDYSWRWLKDNLPGESRTTLVHGDFRNGNLMVTPQGITAVLDWELAHIGDPVRDLGWLCVNSWRFGKRDKVVGGFGDLADLLAGYESVSGTSVSESEVHFWEVFGCFWWAMATLRMANSWRSGETPSLERPVIGRRSSEAQMDCVNLLIPGGFDLPEIPELDAGTQLPLPAELLKGPMELLLELAAAESDPRRGFMGKVAANSLGIAQREMLVGPGLARDEHERLSGLLESDGELDELRWTLVNALRADMALDTPGLAEHLRQTVAGQLAIDQPKYSALST